MTLNAKWEKVPLSSKKRLYHCKSNGDGGHAQNDFLDRVHGDLSAAFSNPRMSLK
jgi:hypothetical protein